MHLDRDVVEELRGRLRGDLLQPGDEAYDSTRKVWNEMVDKRPALIVRCKGVADVIAGVRFAKQHDLLLAVRGGGHNVAGNAVCDGGLMLDCNGMKSVHVDPIARIARAEPGVTWAEINHETQAFGLATTGGVVSHTGCRTPGVAHRVSHTGIAGLTLGGGVGWLAGKHGYTCDNLIAADVLKFYGRICAGAPDDLAINAGIIYTPDGHHVVALIAAWLGDIAEAEARLAPIRTFAAPIADTIGPIPYTVLNTLFDGGNPFGVHRYWKSGFFAELGDELIDRLVERATDTTSPMSAVLLFRIDGACTRKDPSATAFSLREPCWDFDVIAQWTDPAGADGHAAWARRFWKAVEPFSRGVYVNHLDSDDSRDRIRAAYGSNYERLAQLKTKFDPTNFFRMNNNVPPG